MVNNVLLLHTHHEFCDEVDLRQVAALSLQTLVGVSSLETFKYGA